MHQPRMLSRSRDCSGGTCPAMYDHPDLPGQMIGQGKQASDELLSTLTGLAPDENAVIIPREVVAEALRPADEPVGGDELQEQFEMFSWSAFRVEARQEYEGTGPDAQWAALVRANTRWGKTHQRVHVVTEPMTADMREELTSGYGPNADAGEDIRIIAVPDDGDWPSGVPLSDWWLFDSSRLFVLHYNPDGSFKDADRIHDTARIVEACAARDAALHQAVPLREFIAGRPELQNRRAL